MRGAGLAVVLGCVLIALPGCNRTVGLIALDTYPPGAKVYVNEAYMGQTPVKFQFDMDKPASLRIVKEGYHPRTEDLNVNWVKREYREGHYFKGQYVSGGYRGFEVRTLRDLVKLEGQVTDPAFVSACGPTGCVESLNERPAPSCPTSIPVPILEAGDTWRWQDEKGANWYRRYVRKTEDGLLERDSPANEPKTFFDNAHTLRKVYRDGRWVTGNTLDFPYMDKPALDFPLRRGKSWSYMVQARASRSREIHTYRTTFTVRVCEQVRVPAGTFQAMAIEEEQSVVGESSSRGSRTWWYAPDVKYYVKLTHRNTPDPGFWSSRDWELTSYQITPPSATMPATGPPAPQQPTPSPPAPPMPSVSSRGTGAAPSPAPTSTLAPTWERGYEWKFRWSSPRGSGTFVWTMVREEIAADVPHYVVKTDNREIYYTKTDLAWLMERLDGAVDIRLTPAEQRFAWPLVVGKQWGTTVHVERPLQRTTEERQRLSKVEAWEAVTVPAGTFGAFHIVMRDPTGTTASEVWFAPEVRQIIKSKTYYDYGVHYRELLEYKLKATIAPAP